MFKGIVKRPIAVTMVLIAVMVLGITAIKKLPVSLVPDIDIPQITVQVTSPDRSARELNDALLQPLRSELAQVPHLKDIICTAKDGNGLIEMTFEYGTDADYTFIDVNERVDLASARWDASEDRPIIARASATDIPAFFINVSLKDGVYAGGNKMLEMSDFCREVIIRRLEQLPQVAMVDMSGIIYPQLLIIPDMERLRAIGTDESALNNAIRNANMSLGSLSIRDGEYRFDVRFETSVLTREDVEDVWLKLGGRTYQIKELAEVREVEQRVKGKVQSNGKQCVSMAVIKRSDARMADLKKGLDSQMAILASDYPELSFEVTRDQTELLDYSINNMVRNLIYGALFACIIIFFFMQDLRSPVLVVITIPTALILSFLFFYVMKISINIISLSGLVLGLGMMVDNSIITIDNITQRWQKGENLADACVLGTQEVFTPMLSSVLTTCAIFLPLIFMSGIAGAMFYDEAMAVTITLVSALIVSVMVIPVFYYTFYRKQPCFRPNRFISKVSVSGMTGGYERIMSWFFRRRGVMWSIFAVSVVSLFWSCVSAKERYERAVKSFDESKRLFEVGQTRFEMGTITRDQLMQIEVSMLNDSLNVSNSRVNLRTTMNRLCSFIGYQEDTELNLIIDYDIPEIVLDYDDVLQRALENSSFRLRQEVQSVQADESVARAKANRGLSARLTARVGMSGSSEIFEESFTQLKDQEVIGVSLNVPILDWGQGRGRVRMAQAQAQVTRNQVEQDMIDFRQNLYTQVTQFNDQRSQCQISKRAADLANESYELAVRNFSNGNITVTQLDQLKDKRDEAVSSYLGKVEGFWNHYFAIRKATLYDYKSGVDISAEFDKLVK